MTRSPAVAGRFYPGEPDRLRAAMQTLMPAVAEAGKRDALAVVMPHAGYMYSGATAGITISRVRVPETVVVLGPNHHGRGAPLALGADDWRMPFGIAPVDRRLTAAILRHSGQIVEDSEAHEAEHSLEVQIPFLQQAQPALRIVPLAVSRISYELCQSTARELAAAIREFGQPVLLVASTDMSHYEPRPQAAQKDRLAIERILALDPQGLYTTVLAARISMCGVAPTTIALLAALELGDTQSELVRYTDSGEASGDIRQVVGYAGLIIS
jgi:AmmeMemoRadiSam system protein B